MTSPAGATPAGGGNSLQLLEELLDQPREEGWDQKITTAINLALQQIKEKLSGPTEIARVVKLRDKISKLPGENTSSNKASSAFGGVFSLSKSNNTVGEFLSTIQAIVQSIHSGFPQGKKDFVDLIFTSSPEEKK